MDWINKLKVSQKLNLLIAISAVIILLVGLLGIFYTSKANKEMEIMYNMKLVAISSLGDLKANTNEILINNLNLLQNITLQDQNKRLANIDELKAKNVELYKIYLSTPLDPYEKERVDKVPALESVFWSDINKSLQYAKSGKKTQGYKDYKNSIKSINEYRTILDELMKYNQDTADKIFKQNSLDAAFVKILLLSITVGSLVLLVSLGLIVSAGITKPIHRAIDSLTEGTQEVSIAANQVSASSQQLAEGTTEQAAAIQETSSTLEETSSMVNQNRENTQQAAVLAKNSKNYAETSNIQMDKMMTSMEELKNSSNEISKIIKVIDEIAFQTNILSLNAAVEAARAGDAGKGFAVVAEEVRNLAQRSAEAAKETAGIIESNIHLSEQGVNFAKEVQTSIKAIDVESKKVSDLLDEISVATDEQAQGVGQINKAISQMEIVLNQNAQGAQQSAAASEELSSQANKVKEIVNSLIIMVEGQEALYKYQQNVISTYKS